MENTPETVLYMLESQTFYDWYENRFADYIGGAEPEITKEEILADLKKLLGV